MAVIVATRDQVAPTNEQEIEMRVYRCAEAFLPGMVAVWDANGRIVQTNTAPAATNKVAGLALRRAEIGEALTLLQRGFVAGFDVSGMAYGAVIYAGADGELGDTGTVIIGTVLPFTYTGEKMAYIDVTTTWPVAPV